MSIHIHTVVKINIKFHYLREVYFKKKPGKEQVLLLVCGVNIFYINVELVTYTTIPSCETSYPC